jgi:type II secretory pathway pseudopilin PulG
MTIGSFRRRRATRTHGQEGYFLLVLTLFIALMVIGFLSVAPDLKQQIKRQQEEELVHRGTQYARAIRRYVRKFGRYPVKLEDLENTNNLRFLRRRYKDPITGDDFRLIHVGEAKTLRNVGGGPGTPAAAPTGATAQPGGLGARTAAGAAPAAPSFGTPTLGSAFAGTAPGATATTPVPGATAGATGLGLPVAAVAGSGTSPVGAGTSTSESGTNVGTPAAALASPAGRGPTFGGGPIVGVSSTSEAQSLKVLNGKDHYNEWEFVYDPTADRTLGQPGQQQPGVGQPVPGGPAGATGMSTPGLTPAPGAPAATPTPQPPQPQNVGPR